MTESEMTLGRDWEWQPIVGWLASEKLDGCRAYWCGNSLWTRSGRVIHAPAWFTAGLPCEPLDGEVWAGYGQFQASRDAVNHGRWPPNVRFAVFDAVGATGNWLARMDRARGLVANAAMAFTVRPHIIASNAQLASMMERIIGRGGEGVVLRNPKVRNYETGRTSNLLKLKFVPHEFLFN